jgi:hypothetical protein
MTQPCDRNGHYTIHMEHSMDSLYPDIICIIFLAIWKHTVMPIWPKDHLSQELLAVVGNVIKIGISYKIWGVPVDKKIHE